MATAAESAARTGASDIAVTKPNPVTMAPMIEPMPPITTTANTTIMRFEPICGLTL